jgi:3-oxoadipate enol-lactonase
MPSALINGVNLYYEWQGLTDGPVVVFVNGLLTDTSSWVRHLPHFSGRYRCLVYDCRGQGRSDKPDEVYATGQHAADLLGLLDVLGLERVRIVGLSNGGAAALQLAAEQPARVAALAVSGVYASVDTILRAKLNSWIQAMEAGGSPLRFDVATPWVWGATFLNEHYEQILPFREKGANLPIAPARNLIAGALIHDVRAGLAQIAAPLLVVVGEEDVLTPPALAGAIVAAVPRAELVVMPRAGHAAAIEQAEAFSRLVLEFFTRAEAGAAGAAPS